MNKWFAGCGNVKLFELHKKCSGDLGSQSGQGPSGSMLLSCVNMMMIMISYDYSKSVINQRRLVILKAFFVMKILEFPLIFH